MKKPVLHILDVFAEEKFAGNQLAVVRGCQALSGTQMQKIAAEMNYSETAFVASERERDGGYDVRIFTPREEVPFAGHPSLGTAQVLREEVIGRSSEEVVLNLKAGQVLVKIRGGEEDGEVLWMEQPSPAFGRAFDPGRAARVLGLGEGEVDDEYPVQEVSTGLPAILVPLKSLDTLKRCRVHTHEYLELIRESEAKAIYAFCRESREKDNDLSARFFADYYGVPEDPATGSAAGCLAAYLVRHDRSEAPEGGAVAARLEQGHEMGRPSLLHLQANRSNGGGVRVFVGGKVVAVVKGELL